MSFFIPEALSAFAAAGAALQALYQWRRRAVGNARVLIMEIEANYTYLTMVVFDGVALAKIIPMERAGSKYHQAYLVAPQTCG